MASARYYHYKKNYLEEVKCYVQSDEWESAHSVLVQYLACPILLLELNSSSQGSYDDDDSDKESDEDEEMEVENSQQSNGRSALGTLAMLLDRLADNSKTLKVCWSSRLP